MKKNLLFWQQIQEISLKLLSYKDAKFMEKKLGDGKIEHMTRYLKF